MLSLIICLHFIVSLHYKNIYFHLFTYIYLKRVREVIYLLFVMFSLFKLLRTHMPCVLYFATKKPDFALQLCTTSKTLHCSRYIYLYVKTVVIIPLEGARGTMMINYFNAIKHYITKHYIFPIQANLFS